MVADTCALENKAELFNQHFNLQHQHCIDAYNPTALLTNLFQQHRCDDAYLLATQPLSKALLTMIIEREMNCAVEIMEQTDCYYPIDKQAQALGEISLGETVNIYHGHFTLRINIKTAAEWQSYYGKQDKMNKLNLLLNKTVPTHLSYSVQFQIPLSCLTPVCLSKTTNQALGLTSVLSAQKDKKPCYLYTLPH